MRKKITFERKGTFTMRGGAEVELEDDDDYGELYMKGCRQQFKSFLPTEIEYDNDEWSFDFLEEEEDAKN